MFEFLKKKQLEIPAPIPVPVEKRDPELVEKILKKLKSIRGKVVRDASYWNLFYELGRIKSHKYIYMGLYSSNNFYVSIDSQKLDLWNSDAKIVYDYMRDRYLKVKQKEEEKKRKEALSYLD